MTDKLSRRKLIQGGVATLAGVSGIAAAGAVAQHYGLVPPDHNTLYGWGETMTYAAQRVLTSHSLAREFSPAQISARPFANGRPPTDEAFRRLEAGGFADWSLTLDGLVENPGAISLAQIKTYPVHSQITHLACEEGWSYIAQWTGARLSHLLESARVLPHARYVVYRSIQPEWWESIDMADALHPQTILAHGMNGQDLPVPFGGPLRLRVPRQLGYKSIKYITRLTVTDDLKQFGKGLGSASPEDGYSWYAGI